MVKIKVKKDTNTYKGVVGYDGKKFFIMSWNKL